MTPLNRNGSPGVVFATEDPSAPDVAALLRAHLDFARAVTPAGHVHAMDAEGVADDAVTLYGARRDDVVLGVVALRRLDASHAELKSMHVAASARGGGVGRALLEHLLSAAAAAGYRRVSLETGTMDAFAPARALYASAGFVPCAPFGSYHANANSTCMTRDLEPFDVGPNEDR